MKTCGNAPVREDHHTGVVACLLAVVVLMTAKGAQAMSPEQMASLAGTSLLNSRVDALVRRCGMPSAIVDTADGSQPREKLSLENVPMTLSRKDWVIHYASHGPGTESGAAWRNPAAASTVCMSQLARLDLRARGEAGVMSVTKRNDNQGYITTYAVPEDLFAAHEVIALTAYRKERLPVATIHKQYGAPDEVVEKAGGASVHRYWVVQAENRMPLSVHAVEFEVRGADKTSGSYTVYTSGNAFVQEKFDALTRYWLRIYVND